METRFILFNRKTATEYLEQVQKLVDNENITTDMSSFTIFMNLLGKVLKHLVQSDAKNQIMKIIGKIYFHVENWMSNKIFFSWIRSNSHQVWGIKAVRVDWSWYS